MRVATFFRGHCGSLFCTGALHEGGQGRKVLIIPPFAEELNKSRHVLAALCRSLEAAGHDVLLPDLYGTGDSEGQFSEATLEIWRGDLDAAVRYLEPREDFDVIALRAGALIAVDLVNRHRIRSMTLLHPIVEGRQQLNQLLRLRLAGALTGGGKKETAAQLREQLASGHTLEIAGYGLSPQLAADLEALSLSASPPLAVAQLNWIELAAAQDRPLMPASQRLLEDWEAQGVPVASRILVCDQFWATQEIAQCPAIVEAALVPFVH